MSVDKCALAKAEDQILAYLDFIEGQIAAVTRDVFGIFTDQLNAILTTLKQKINELITKIGKAFTSASSSGIVPDLTSLKSALKCTLDSVVGAAQIGVKFVGYYAIVQSLSEINV